jgi:7-carboxy-7-deazaguanine synthase
VKVTSPVTDKATVPKEDRLRITEIFHSLQGESATTGCPTVFIRLTGCPLRCHYCDTAYAFTGGSWMSLEEIVDALAPYRTRYVTVTGGEPLAQKSSHRLLSLLCDQSYQVSLETSGAMDIEAVDPRVIKVMDLKTPGSGEESRNRYQNIEHLNAQDQIKFVICDRADYDWARAMLDEFQLPARCQVLVSPSHGQLEAGTLADWILADQLPIRFQIQLHKYLWGDEPGR